MQLITRWAALKCDLRDDDEVDRRLRERGMGGTVRYEQGLEVAQRIRATRYLGAFVWGFWGLFSADLGAAVVGRMFGQDGEGR